jgi:hypothetical protein
MGRGTSSVSLKPGFAVPGAGFPRSTKSISLFFKGQGEISAESVPQACHERVKLHVSHKLRALHASCTLVTCKCSRIFLEIKVSGVGFDNL